MPLHLLDLRYLRSRFSDTRATSATAVRMLCTSFSGFRPHASASSFRLWRWTRSLRAGAWIKARFCEPNPFAKVRFTTRSTSPTRRPGVARAGAPRSRRDPHDLLEGGAGQAEFDDVLLVRRPF